MTPTASRQVAISVIAALVAGGVAFGFGMRFFRHVGPSDPTPITSSAAQASKTPTERPQVAAAAIATPSKPQKMMGAPAFDIVRIEPQGDAVIAGRSAPGAIVELLRGNEVLGREKADQNGEFVLTPPRLPSGNYQIALRSKLPDGTEATSERSVAVTVQPRPSESATSMSKPQDKALTVRSEAAAPVKRTESVVLKSVAITEEGKFIVLGHASAGAAIKLYLNGTAVASATAGPDQQFSITINEGVKPGSYHVRLEEVDPTSGVIIAHAEQQFDVPEPKSIVASEPVQTVAAEQGDKAAPAQLRVPAAQLTPAISPSNVIVPKIVTATVSQGDSLWRISRHSYGAGDLYPLIFRANRGKIRNPNLIYPKQMLVLPSR